MRIFWDTICQCGLPLDQVETFDKTFRRALDSRLRDLGKVLNWREILGYRLPGGSQLANISLRYSSFYIDCFSERLLHADSRRG